MRFEGSTQKSAFAKSFGVSQKSRELLLVSFDEKVSLTAEESVSEVSELPAVKGRECLTVPLNHELRGLR